MCYTIIDLFYLFYWIENKRDNRELFLREKEKARVRVKDVNVLLGLNAPCTNLPITLKTGTLSLSISTDAKIGKAVLPNRVEHSTTSSAA